MACKCFIMEEDSRGLMILKKYIETIPQLELSGTCINAAELLNLIPKEPVDLIFIDLQKPINLGFEVLKVFPGRPHVIYTSAYRDFAVEAFEHDAVDYLLKPFSFNRFLKALNKVLKGNFSQTKSFYLNSNFIFLRADRKMIKVSLEEILYVESYRDYVVIHLEEKRKLRVKLPLNQVERMLPANQFLRMHRSYIVPISKISAFTKTDVEIGKIELPIGKSFVCAFQKLTPHILDLPDGVAER